VASGSRQAATLAPRSSWLAAQLISESAYPIRASRAAGAERWGALPQSSIPSIRKGNPAVPGRARAELSATPRRPATWRGVPDGDGIGRHLTSRCVVLSVPIQIQRPHHMRPRFCRCQPELAAVSTPWRRQALVVARCCFTFSSSGWLKLGNYALARTVFVLLMKFYARS
jgi:hypothetical protein